MSALNPEPCEAIITREAKNEGRVIVGEDRFHVEWGLPGQPVHLHHVFVIDRK